MTPNRKPLYAKIAIARKQLAGMDDEATYRDFLENLFGVRSASDLNFHQLSTLVQKFALMGAEFTSKGSNKRVTPHARPDWIEITDSMPHAPVKRQILAIWKKLGYSMSSLDTRVKRAFNVDLFVWLHNLESLSTLLSDLQRREKAFDKKTLKPTAVASCSELIAETAGAVELASPHIVPTPKRVKKASA